MATKSPSSDFIKAMRIKRKMSKKQVALYAGLEFEEYEVAEDNPTKTPLFILSQIFKAFDITSEEFTKFQIIAHQELKEKRDREKQRAENELESHEPIQTAKPALSLSGSRRLNSSLRS